MLPKLRAQQTIRGGVFEVAGESSDVVWEDNISEAAVEYFKQAYPTSDINSDRIFAYVYAMLHHPVFLLENSDSLAMETPRIPCAPDFNKFVDIGENLLECHLGWIEGEPYETVKIETAPGFDENSEHDWRFKKLAWENDGKKAVKATQKNSPTDTYRETSEADFKDAIVINPKLAVRGIPKEAHTWKIGSRSALDWIVDMYRIRQYYVKTEKGGEPKISKNETGDLFTEENGNKKQDGLSVLYPQDANDIQHSIGVINDPNTIFEHPKELTTLIGRVTRCAVETHKLLEELAEIPYWKET